MVLNDKKKELKKSDKIKKELSIIFSKLEQAGFPEKDISNITDKLKKMIKAEIAKDNLNKIIHFLIMKTSFKHKFLKTGIRRIPRLLAEFGIQVKLKISQPSRQAESTESYGYLFPHIAVDPKGRWIAQLGSISPQGVYRVEIYELKDSEVFYHHFLEFKVRGTVFSISSNNRVKSLTFNPDGSKLWVSVGTKPNLGPFKTWLVKFDTKDWNYNIFGPIAAYEYFNQLFSRSHFYRIKTINESNIEKIISPVPIYRNVLGLFDPINPERTEPWKIDAKPPDRPDYFVRFTDIAVIGNLLYVTGWASNAGSDGMPNPRASLVILNINNRSVEHGPYYIPEMMGYYDYSNNSPWPLKIRPTSNGNGAYLIAERLAPKNKGGTTPDHSGFAYIDIQTGKTIVRDDYFYESAGTRFQSTRDILEFGGKLYIQILKRELSYNIWSGLIQLNENLNLTGNLKTVPVDWWDRIYFELHPKRSQDVIISAVRAIYHPNNPSGLIALWEAF